MITAANKFPIPELGHRLSIMGAREVLVKHLAPNDNSKNQIYLATDISALTKIPSGTVHFVPGKSTKREPGDRGPIFHAPVALWWLRPEDGAELAPATKLIIYPQYGRHGEVRLSGFVRGCASAPAWLFDPDRSGRTDGRVLVLAPLEDGRVIAAAFGPETGEAASLRAARGEAYGPLDRYELTGQIDGPSSENLLLTRLREIHQQGWLEPVYLRKDGSFAPCIGPNCGGVTLESYLGIRANGNAEPDFHGWEVKQRGVTSFEQPGLSPVTLMTPEPSGGMYVEEGAAKFVRSWGYSDIRGKPGRINFGGVYRTGGKPNARTRLRLALQGYDAASGRFEGQGELQLVDSEGSVAASWSFEKLMDHWRRKHAKAVYVLSQKRTTPDIRYCYGSNIHLAEGASFSSLLKAFSDGVVYYDPAMKIEDSDTERPKLKRRSQFRINSRHIAALYERNRKVSLYDH